MYESWLVFPKGWAVLREKYPLWICSGTTCFSDSKNFLVANIVGPEMGQFDVLEF